MLNPSIACLSPAPHSRFALSRPPRSKNPTQTPNTSLGRQAATVPTTAISTLAAISAPSIQARRADNWRPKSRKWNASGRMMQMPKQATLPRSDMMRSKSGKRTAKMTKVATSRRRTAMRRVPRVSAERGGAVLAFWVAARAATAVSLQSASVRGEWG